jgi:hypothetical protein
VLHPGGSRVAASWRRDMAACLVWCFVVPVCGHRQIVTACRKTRKKFSI